MTTMRLAAAMIDLGWLPDPVIRFGIRRLLADRLETERNRSLADPAARHASWAELFGTRDGNEWQVAHYRFVKP